MTFHSMLKAQGFKRIKSYAKGTTCMISEDGLTAVDIYTETYGKWAWARGRGIPDAPSYPGGMSYHEPERLLEQLTQQPLTWKTPLLTDQQIENGIDWTSRSANARAMTPHAVRTFYEAQITKDRALIQTLVNALDSTEALDNGCPLPTWQKEYDEMCDMRSNALDAAKDNGFTPTEG